LIVSIVLLSQFRLGDLLTMEPDGVSGFQHFQLNVLRVAADRRGNHNLLARRVKNFIWEIHYESPFLCSARQRAMFIFSPCLAHS
jgi:hypothetical protein